MAVFTIGSKTLSGSPTGGAVGGASNLTTVGAVPYVSASGVLNQDATNLFWDATNKRLGVGTASPADDIEISKAATPTLRLNRTTTSSYGQVLFYESGSFSGAVYSIGSTFATVSRRNALEINSNSGPVSFAPSGTEAGRFAVTTGNLLIGGTTDGNYKLDVQKSGSSGTLRVYDQTATTGSTRAVIQAGAGQSGNVLEVLDSGGGFLSGINSVGASIFAANQWLTSLGGNQRLYFTAGGATYLKAQTDITLRNVSDAGMMSVVSISSIKVPSGSVYGWSNAADSQSGTIDLSLSRASAGVLQVGDGGANSNGTLKAAALQAVVANTGYPELVTTTNSSATNGSWKLQVPGSAAGSRNGSLEILDYSGSPRYTISVSGDHTWILPAGVQAASLSSTGTYTLYNQTATTGNTKEVIRAGQGQTTNLTEWQNNAGSYLSKVNSSGEIWTNTLYASVDGTNYKQGFGQLFYDLGSGNTIRFFNTSNVNSGSADLGMYRNNPGVLEINNGTAGTLRDLTLRNITASTRVASNGDIILNATGVVQFSNPADGVLTLKDNAGTSFGRLQFGGTTSSFPALKRNGNSFDVRLADDSAYAALQAVRLQTAAQTVSQLPAAAAAFAGSIQYVNDANATTIGSTVAGGGSNKVMVWCDGTNWKIYAS